VYRTEHNSKRIEIPEWVDVGHIIPPNLIKNTYPEKESDTPTKYQSSATHFCKKYKLRMKQQWGR
jgi:hypothetical protein